MFFLNIRMRLWPARNENHNWKISILAIFSFRSDRCPRLALQLASVKKMPGINTAMAHAHCSFRHACPSICIKHTNHSLSQHTGHTHCTPFDNSTLASQRVSAILEHSCIHYTTWTKTYLIENRGRLPTRSAFSSSLLHVHHPNSFSQLHSSTII